MRQLKRLVPQGIKNYYHKAQSLTGSILYSFPSKNLKVIGVTGTDGKTTTVNLIYHLLKRADLEISMISSVNAIIGKKEYDTGFHVTTPDPLDIQKYLAEMVKAGSKYAVIEVTSHALDQHRVSGVDFFIAVITNITHEHLDYHKTSQNYLRSKAKLFKNVEYSVLNKDDSSFPYLQDLAGGEIVTYGIKQKAQIRAENIETSSEGTTFDITSHERKISVSTSLIGQFNVYNILASVSVAKILGLNEESIARSLKIFEAVPGRMEKINTKRDFSIFIDFAHTPNALENVLRLTKGMSKGRIIVCFGAASERDSEKRPVMGKIAAKLADLVILTNEDPRFEDPNKILTDIAGGVVKGGGVLNKSFWMIEDRQKAIKFAIEKAKPRDIVLVLGKGHEKSISIKGKEYPWSDKEAVVQALRAC